jgi:hypothetical protein
VAAVFGTDDVCMYGDSWRGGGCVGAYGRRGSVSSSMVYGGLLVWELDDRGWILMFSERVVELEDDAGTADCSEILGLRGSASG